MLVNLDQVCSAFQKDKEHGLLVVSNAGLLGGLLVCCYYFTKIAITFDSDYRILKIEAP